MRAKAMPRGRLARPALVLTGPVILLNYTRTLEVVFTIDERKFNPRFLRSNIMLRLRSVLCSIVIAFVLVMLRTPGSIDKLICDSGTFPSNAFYGLAGAQHPHSLALHCVMTA